MAWIAANPDYSSSYCKPGASFSYVCIHFLEERLSSQLDQIHDFCKELGEEGRLIEATGAHLHRFRDRIE